MLTQSSPLVPLSSQSPPPVAHSYSHGASSGPPPRPPPSAANPPGTPPPVTRQPPGRPNLSSVLPPPPSSSGGNFAPPTAAADPSLAAAPGRKPPPPPGRPNSSLPPPPATENPIKTVDVEAENRASDASRFLRCDFFVEVAYQYEAQSKLETSLFLGERFVFSSHRSPSLVSYLFLFQLPHLRARFGKHVVPRSWRRSEAYGMDAFQLCPERRLAVMHSLKFGECNCNEQNFESVQSKIKTLKNLILTRREEYRTRGSRPDESVVTGKVPLRFARDSNLYEYNLQIQISESRTIRLSKAATVLGKILLEDLVEELLLVEVGVVAHLVPLLPLLGPHGEVEHRQHQPQFEEIKKVEKYERYEGSQGPKGEGKVSEEPRHTIPRRALHRRLDDLSPRIHQQQSRKRHDIFGQNDCKVVTLF